MRLLDLFCGAGGAAAGYQRAGFHVSGVDFQDQPNYCGDEFARADAIDILKAVCDWGGQFDAIHASPPCQHYSKATYWRGAVEDHPDMVELTRELLLETELPFVIENVNTAPLTPTFILCGTMFGLPIRRHRWFECNWPLNALTPGHQHRRSDFSHDHGKKQTEREYADAMECSWMTVFEAREAIPPAYTEFIGTALAAHLQEGAIDARRPTRPV